MESTQDEVALTTSELDQFAATWLGEAAGTADADETGRIVVVMVCLSSLDELRVLLGCLMRHATTDEHLRRIATGYVETLLSRYGHALIDEFETRAGEDHRFAKMLGAVGQHLMDTETWFRIRVIQATASVSLAGP